MNDWLLLYVSLSLSGTLVTLAIVLFKPLIRHFSKTWQYNIWLLVLLRLLIPYSPEISIVGGLFHYAEAELFAGETSGEGNPTISRMEEGEYPQETEPDNYILQEAADADAGFSFVTDHLFGVLWLITSLFLLIRKAYGYRQFAQAVKKESSVLLTGPPLHILQKIKAEMGIEKNIAVCANPLIKAPMLLGIRKPMIVLPSGQIETEAFKYIYRHELTHYRRKDFLYKWLTEITIALHWFNPAVYWVRKQINRDCELSCDEKAVLHLSGEERKSYGETLLYFIRFNNQSRPGPVSLSMNNDGKLLKERLCWIMKARRKTKRMVFLSVIVTAVLCCCSILTGAYYTINAWKTPSGGIDRNTIMNDSADPVKKGKDSTVVIESVELRRYEGESGHPYIHDIKTNNTTKKIVESQYGMLAFDKEGNPLKIDWHCLDTDTEPAYYILYTEEIAEIEPGGTSDVFGGWSLNFFGKDPNVDKIAYVLLCDKKITFEDGSVWKNPDYKKWLKAYRGKKVDADILESYYPYVEKIKF